MSRRSTVCGRCSELEAEVEKWRSAYRELAMAIARREGYPNQAGTMTPAKAVTAPVGGFFSAEPTLPPTILAAIEDTTAPYSDARTAAIEAARGMLEGGVKPEEVETQLRRGEEIAV